MGHLLETSILVFIGLILLWFAYSIFTRLGRRASAEGESRSAVETPRQGNPKTCPVCRTYLQHGERIKSAAFPETGTHERLMHIFGCPFCYGDDPVAPRRCPVCGATLRPQDFLVARLFSRTGRSHVHVLGCTRCRERRNR